MLNAFDQLQFVGAGLAALVLSLAGILLSATIVRRLLGRALPPVRLLALAICGMSIAILAFQVHYFSSTFTLYGALPVALVAIGLLRIRGATSGLAAELARDLRWLVRAVQLALRPRNLWLNLPAVAAALALLVRASILPPIAWDALTYHAVKAAMWVQGTSLTRLDTPEPWNSYRLYPGGEEALMAWTMLPFRSDLLAGLVDVGLWALFGLSVYALGRELGLRARHAWVAALYVVFLPASWLSAGSFYVEPGMTAMLLTSAVFLTRAWRREHAPSLFLGLAAAGLAGSLKVTALPLTAALILLAAAGAWRARAADPARNSAMRRAFLAGLAVCGCLILPWLYENFRFSGYPLSPFSIHIAGLTLGSSNPAMEWYRTRPELGAYAFATEFNAFQLLFNSPMLVTPHLSIVSLIPLTGMPFALIRLARRDPMTALMLAVIAGWTLLFFLSPACITVRLVWSENSGRFLLAAIAIAVLLLGGALRSRPGLGRAYQGLFGATVLLHLASGARDAWVRLLAPFEHVALPIGMACAVLILAGVWSLTRAFAAALEQQRPVSASDRVVVATVIASLAFLTLLPVLDAYRQRVRYDAADDSLVLHVVPSAWRPAAEYLDTPDRGHRIAITGGPVQNADRWLIYHFLGRSFQNRLLYVPISADGRIVHFGPDGALARSGDFGAWLERLRAQRIDHIYTFPTRSIEMTWMEAHPELFTRVYGVAEEALFALKAVPGAPAVDQDSR